MGREQAPGLGMIAGLDQPLIGVPADTPEGASVHYVTDESALESLLASLGAGQSGTWLGAWDDLDWEHAESELDRIRHENPPTPPLDL